MTAAVVVIAQRKGGAGKTTLAAHLGAAWAAMGRDVALIDTDPQASLSRWYQNREARLGGGRTGLRFAAAIGWHAPAEIRRRGGNYDILLVDSRASGDSEVRMLMRCASLVVVPVQPSPVDVWATLPTLEMARRERVPVLLVLNRVPSRASLTTAMRKQLACYEASLAASTVGNRVAFAAAFAEGWGITECAPGTSGAEEIDALASELLGLLPSAGRVQPRHDAWALLAERPAPAIATPTLANVAARDAERTAKSGGVLDAPEFAALGQASDGASAEDWAPLEDQLRAGIASLKRRLARRSK